MTGAMLAVEDLVVRFAVKREGLFGKPGQLHAVDGVSFEIGRGRTLGLVGESGSGKSTSALAIARLIPAVSGRVRLGGIDLLGLEGEALRDQRRRMQFIFQDPYSSLNPRLRAGAIVREPLDRLGIGTPAERTGRVDELFTAVGLRPEQQRLFPHQFSGGQRQRLGIARALASKPDLIICDEPVSALDVAVQAQILNLLARLQRDLGLTCLFISHDLGVVQHMCDDVAVMYMGHIVEHASRRRLFTSPPAPVHAGAPVRGALRGSVPPTPRAHHAERGSAEPGRPGPGLPIRVPLPDGGGTVPGGDPRVPRAGGGPLGRLPPHRGVTRGRNPGLEAVPGGESCPAAMEQFHDDKRENMGRHACRWTERRSGSRRPLSTYSRAVMSSNRQAIGGSRRNRPA